MTPLLPDERIDARQTAIASASGCGTQVMGMPALFCWRSYTASRDYLLTDYYRMPSNHQYGSFISV